MKVPVFWWFSRWLNRGTRYPSLRRRAFSRWLAGLAVLAALLGTIVFAVAAAGHQPFSFGGSKGASVQAPAFAGDFAQWTAGLGTKNKHQIANDLATAFAAAFGTRPGHPTAQGLRGVFESLLTSSGVEASQAAARLLSLTAQLTQAEQSMLLTTLNGVLSGAAKELGSKSVDGLIALFRRLVGAAGSDTLRPIFVINVAGRGSETETVSVPTVTVRVSLKNAEDVPTSFLWFNRAWGRNDRMDFAHEFQTKHSDEKQVVVDRALATLYYCHPIVRRVLGIAAPPRRGDATSRCKKVARGS